MKPAVYISVMCVCIACSLHVAAQQLSTGRRIPKFLSYDSANQKDALDIARAIFRRRQAQHPHAMAASPSKVHLTAIPAAGYSLQTGWAAILSANVSFLSGEKDNLSTATTSFTYSQYKQYIIPLHTNLWSRNGEYNFQSEWRFLKYPSFTYGLGTRSHLDDGYMIDYSYLRLQQNISRRIARNLYAGLGVHLDFYWNISETDPPAGKQTDFQKYGLGKKETAVGPAFNLLYDSRKNPINPENGGYFELSYRPKFKWLGSDATWQALVIDYRIYRHFPAGSHNTLAFWSYNWLTFSGKPPYLLLPSTGWDAYVNTGRGFIQGRYRGDEMLYAEGEYRFGITSNGLFGGVVFANAQTFTDRAGTIANSPSLSNFDPIEPAYGVGLRIKVNKYSRANLCIDYAWGSHGSHGVAVNLGEVF